jgi:SPP1 gp7 family putative phage head morphogenesis protein
MEVERAANKFFDMMMTHTVHLERFSAGVRKKAVSMLKELEKELVTELSVADVTGTSVTAFRRRRMEALLKQTRNTIATAYSRIGSETASDVRKAAMLESEFIAGSINTVAGVDLATVALTAQQLKAATTQIIDGAISRKWWRKQSAGLRDRFERQMQIGMVRGEPLSELVRRVRGRREFGFKDGIMSLPYSQASALAITSVHAAANAARDATYDANDDVVKGVQWISTLDKRTTPICIARDGKRYTLNDHRPVGHDLPWEAGPGRIHWRCRSTSIAVLKSWQELGGRIIRSNGRKNTFNSVFNRRLAELGLPKEQIELVKKNARASMDGQVASTLTYEKWLEGKSPAFQNYVLGRKRADLWRAGRLAAKDIVSQDMYPIGIETFERLTMEVMGPLPDVYVGKTTGMNKSQFYLKTLLENEELKRTDKELQAIWDAEFPPSETRQYRVSFIRGRINKGFYGKRADFTSHAYDANKNIIPKKVVVPKPKAVTAVPPPITVAPEPPILTKIEEIVNKGDAKSINARLEREKLTENRFKLRDRRDELFRSAQVGSEEYLAVTNEIDKVSAEIEKLYVAEKAVKDEVRTEVHALIAPKDGPYAKFTVQVKETLKLSAERVSKLPDYSRQRATADLKDLIEEGVDFTRRATAKISTLDDRYVVVRDFPWGAPTQRAYYDHSGHYYGAGVLLPGHQYRYMPMIQMSRMYDAAYTNGVVSHELGHFVEHNDGLADRLAKDFLHKRAGGKKPTTIGGRRKEKGWRDKFPDHYCGRYYDSGTTEIVSMGMQMLYKDPYEFWKADKEYFELMMRVLRYM